MDRKGQQGGLAPSIIIAAVIALGVAPGQASAEWLKGNTHCHTSASPDSSTPIESLMSWYKDNDYDFVVLTDHNVYTTQAALNALRDARGRALVDAGFLLIPGEELTTNQHHINGIDLPARVAPANSISAAFELIWANGGLPQLNHPEYNFLQSRDIIEEISEMRGPMFLEIYNSHPIVIERSGPSSEDIWDGVLSTGQLMWGVAVDDAHTLVNGDRPPGGGFIYVDAASQDKAAILDAMERGRFYASTGAQLADFSHTRSLYDVDAPGAAEIVFIGGNGAVLERVRGDFASYRFRGDERYVRARVTSPEGLAWTQPVFVDGLPPNEAPTASIAASTTRGPAPLAVQLDGGGSSDPEGQIATWRWDFGDGGVGRGEVILHQYEAPGRYTVELTVFDDQGEPGRQTLDIEVTDEGAEPEPSPEPEPGAQPEPEANQPEAGQPQPDDAEPSSPRPGSSGQIRDEGCAQAPGSGGSGRGGWPAALLLAALLGRAIDRRGRARV